MAPSPIKCYIRAHYMPRYFKQFMMRANVNMERVNDEDQTREEAEAIRALDDIIY